MDAPQTPNLVEGVHQGERMRLNFSRGTIRFMDRISRPLPATSKSLCFLEETQPSGAARGFFTPQGKTNKFVKNGAQKRSGNGLLQKAPCYGQGPRAVSNPTFAAGFKLHFPAHGIPELKALRDLVKSFPIFSRDYSRSISKGSQKQPQDCRSRQWQKRIPGSSEVGWWSWWLKCKWHRWCRHHHHHHHHAIFAVVALTKPVTTPGIVVALTTCWGRINT